MPGHFALHETALRRGARNARMGDGTFELLLVAPHGSTTRASAAPARTEDGVERRRTAGEHPRSAGAVTVL